MLLDLPPEPRVRAEPPQRLELDREPVGVLRDHGVEQRAEPFLEPDLRQALRRLGRELEEDRFLVREVVEDRTAGEPRRLLEASDGRALVAVAREAGSGRVENLAAPALLVLGRDLRHAGTLQNRTDVLY